MRVKQKILFYPKPFDHPTIFQTPNRTDRPMLSQTVVLRAGMTTGLLAVGPSKGNWFWQLMGPELLVTNSPKTEGRICPSINVTPLP